MVKRMTVSPLLKEILTKSRAIDARFESISSVVNGFSITFVVPRQHYRGRTLQSYELVVETVVEGRWARRGGLVIAAQSVIGADWLKHDLENEENDVIGIESSERTVKNKTFIDELIAERLERKRPCSHIVAVGGGLVLNVAAYVAEQWGCGLWLVPTTVLGMADGSGGKVRLNYSFGTQWLKHYYKSYYEPDGIVVDRRFLGMLPVRQKRIGLAEIVKHGLFQSPSLLRYIEQHGESMLFNNEELLLATMWAAALKSVCLEVDVEENENGSRRILRAGHDFSDRLEERLDLRMPHGVAVAIGICESLKAEGDSATLLCAMGAFRALGIPSSVAEASLLGYLSPKEEGPAADLESTGGRVKV